MTSVPHCGVSAMPASTFGASREWIRTTSACGPRRAVTRSPGSTTPTATSCRSRRTRRNRLLAITGLHVRRRQPFAAVGARQLRMYGVAARLVTHLDRGAVLGSEPLVAPTEERDHDWPEVAAHLRQPVLEPVRPVRVLALFEHPAVDKRLQPLRQDWSWRARALEEVLETADTHECIPQDEHRPPITDD